MKKESPLLLVLIDSPYRSQRQPVGLAVLAEWVGHSPRCLGQADSSALNERSDDIRRREEAMLFTDSSSLMLHGIRQARPGKPVVPM